MAHGNVSDLVFLALLGVVIQLWAFPDLLFQDLGPFKAQFKSKNADMDAMIKFIGGLFLMIGMAFSGVKWNPINGKMAGFGGLLSSGFVAYSCFKADSYQFVLRPFYAYLLALLVGLIHIFLFPSNPLPEKTPATKNNHGNASDLVALSLISSSFLCWLYPDHLFQDFGPFKQQFKTVGSEELSSLIKLAGCLMMIIALILSGVKWNPINGKMAGFGGFIAAGYTAYSTFKSDNDAFVMRVLYVNAILIFMGALHIFAFPSNPLVKSGDVKKQA